ncbi:hypothetical protein [Actinomyces radicidentis]|uniref:hypothetical protein n=1 Tax=Actinomyces radicidentis TaxID=111015 RepID=UPI0028ECC47D|nr:hypothetical protein [Actinomyces radicidentis]
MSTAASVTLIVLSYVGTAWASGVIAYRYGNRKGWQAAAQLFTSRWTRAVQPRYEVTVERLAEAEGITADTVRGADLTNPAADDLPEQEDQP